MLKLDFVYLGSLSVIFMGNFRDLQKFLYSKFRKLKTLFFSFTEANILGNKPKSVTLSKYLSFLAYRYYSQKHVK
jgi:hypothetical protein